MKRILLLLCGWVSLGLAVLGIFLPVLPTTPLVLLGAICFSSSSDKMYRILLNSRLFGPYIENYRTKQGIPLAVKVRAIALLWLLLGLSALLMQKLWSTVLFAVIGTGVTIHLVILKTKRSPGQKTHHR